MLGLAVQQMLNPNLLPRPNLLPWHNVDLDQGYCWYRFELPLAAAGTCPGAREQMSPNYEEISINWKSPVRCSGHCAWCHCIIVCGFWYDWAVRCRPWMDNGLSAFAGPVSVDFNHLYTQSVHMGASKVPGAARGLSWVILDWWHWPLQAWSVPQKLPPVLESTCGLTGIASGGFCQPFWGTWRPIEWVADLVQPGVALSCTQKLPGKLLCELQEWTWASVRFLICRWGWV